MSNPAIENDPWLTDDGFNNVDFKRTDDLYTDEDIAPINTVMQPEVIANVGPPSEQFEPLPAPVAVEPALPAEEEPLVINNPDGSSISIEKSSKGWKGTVDLGIGAQQQVYYGKTKNELLASVLTAQAHATRKIREQNKQIKLGDPTTTVQQVQQDVASAVGRQLSADEKFELKTLFETDPDKAFDTWFQKRTGRTVEQVVDRSDKGYTASTELYMESENKKFLAANPTYFPDLNYENYSSLLKYLAKHKLGRGMTPANQNALLHDLIERGFYTAENLEEAFVELSEAGLLIEAPRPPKQSQPPVAQPQPSAAAQPTERIVRQETRTRAGLGIRQSEVSPTRQPDSEKPPSAEDLNSYTDEQIAALYKQTLVAARGSRR